MNTAVTLLDLAQPSTETDPVPQWVHLCPAGTFKGIKGDRLTLADPDAVIRASMAAGKLVLDENHSTDLAAPKGKPAPARAWITRMENRADGLWGFADWTPKGRELMAAKEYRAISPVIESRSGAVTRILRAALTNDPDLPVVTLHSHNTPEKTMDIAKVRKALGLPDTATEEDALAAMTESRTSVTLHSRVATVLGVDAGADNGALLAALQTRLKDNTSNDRVAELEGQIKTIKEQASRDKVMGLMAQAAAEGAVITDKQRDNLITLHSANADLAVDLIKDLPRTNLNGTKITRHSAAGAGSEVQTGISDAVLAPMAAAFGLKAEDIKKEAGHGASV
ncbi:phage protease [Gluconobacter albidus]|uniref:phage protease n=1 Tax=Gluconobacter albidus TaxID=318683 RepID=UPI000783FD72|nr:phage protease [Gluconobacter albidus]